MEDLPFISVIMPMLNASRFIESCLRAVNEQDYPREKFEIIVVDNGSTDNSVQLSRVHADRILEYKGVTISALRNLGAKKSTGKILAFIDADCLPDKDWLFNIAKYTSGDGCITGSKYALPEKANWIEKIWFHDAACEIREVEYINAGNLVIQKDLFFTIGGFDENLKTGEDCEFCSRGKRFARVISNPGIRVVHLGNPKSIREFVDREIWHGMGSFGNLRNKWFDKSLICAVAFSVLSFGQLAGLYYWGTLGNPAFFLSASLGIMIMVFAALYYKGLFLKGRLVLQAVIVYYMYFLARSISLLFIFLGINYQKSRSARMESKLPA